MIQHSIARSLMSLRRVAAVAVVGFTLGSCEPTEFLEVTDPDIINPGDIRSIESFLRAFPASDSVSCGHGSPPFRVGARSFAVDATGGARTPLRENHPVPAGRRPGEFPRAASV